MGYRRMNINDLKEIRRRLLSGQSITLISDSTGYDRKTIRGYRDIMTTSGLLASTNPEIEENLSAALFKLLPANERSSPVANQFMEHKDEIIRLTTRSEDPLKPKSVYIVLCDKYGITGSYESFKVFMRTNHLQAQKKKQFPRLELPPGLETQIDYGKCGMHTDPSTEKRRVVNGFVAKLSCSRLPFVESHIHMVEFFGGVTKYLTIDNLKAGVLKPHIYTPQLNRSYAEFAEHYGTFINACIPGHPKGKAKDRFLKSVNYSGVL